MRFTSNLVTGSLLALACTSSRGPDSDQGGSDPEDTEYTVEPVVDAASSTPATPSSGSEGGEPTASAVESHAFDEVSSVGVSGEQASEIFGGAHEVALIYADPSEAALHVELTVTGETLGPVYSNAVAAVSTDGRGAEGQPSLKLMADIELVSSDGLFDEQVSTTLMVFDAEHARLDMLLGTESHTGSYELPASEKGSYLRFVVLFNSNALPTGEVLEQLDGADEWTPVASW